MRRRPACLATAGALLLVFGAAPTLRSEVAVPRAAIEQLRAGRPTALASHARRAFGRPGLQQPSASPIRAVQGASPFGIAITKDGQYAYLTFDLSEDVFKVRLSDFVVVGATDLSAYFPAECENIALDVSEKKLFVYTPTWRKLLVIDTDTMSLTGSLDNYPLTGMLRSQYGARLITWNGGATIRFVDTNTLAVTQQTYSGLHFSKLQERTDSQTKWYAVTQGLPGGQGPLTVGSYDSVSKSWDNSVTFSRQTNDATGGVFALKVLPNENKAYVATMSGFYTGEYRAYGWLYAVDLARRQVQAIAVDGGALCLAASASKHRLYVGTGWPIPADNNLLVVDTLTDTVLGRIPLGKTRYNWNHTQMNVLQIDPANPEVLYATDADANAFIKVRLDTLTLERVLVLNQEDVSPQFFARRPTQDSGYVLLHNTTNALDLNSGRAVVNSSVTLPVTQTAYYDVAFNSTGRMYVAQGQRILELDATDQSLIATHALPQGTPSVWQLVLSSNEKMLYSVARTPSPRSQSFLAINTTTWQVDSRITLVDPGGAVFTSRPYEVPDQGKVYVLGGLDHGAVTIDMFETNTQTFQKRITFDQPGLLGISAGPNYPFAYDSRTHTLFVGATEVVLAIDTQTDTIKQVIRLGDSAKAIGLQPSQLTYFNADGLAYNPRENCLYIAHWDRSYVSIFDLAGNRYLPRLIPLKGYAPRQMFANDDVSRIYVLNVRSDNISVIDTITKTVENVIDLHEYVPVVSPGM